MKLLLSGPRGNLGTELFNYSTDEIVELDRDDWQRLDDILANGIDVVIHAAYDLKNNIANSPTHIMDSNLMTTMKLIEAMKKNKTPRMIFISTCAVYGESMKTNEEIQCCPISINGIVKLLNEKIIAEYCLQNRIKYEIYRVFNAYGGNDQFSIFSHLRKSIESGREFQLNNSGISQRDFIHVEDVAKIIIKLVRIEHSYTHINIGTGVSTRISNIIDIITKKYPQLKIKNNKVCEAEYSRANISKLNSLINYDFIKVNEYVENCFTVN